MQYTSVDTAVSKRKTRQMTAARKQKMDQKFQEKWMKRKLLAILPLVSAWARRQQLQVQQQLRSKVELLEQQVERLQWQIKWAKFDAMEEHTQIRIHTIGWVFDRFMR